MWLSQGSRSIDASAVNGHAPAMIKIARLKRLLPLVAWAGVLAIVFWTLGPVRDRPQLGHPETERFLAYALLGMALTAAYGRHYRLIAIGLVFGAIALEIGQFFVPHRDPHLQDCVAKALGGVSGVAIIMVARATWAWRQKGAQAGTNSG
jgi:VanZ family protein